MEPFKIICSYLNPSEVELTQEGELRNILHDLSRHGNMVVLLDFHAFGVFTIGVGTPYGFVEFMGESGSPPYLIATDELIIEGKETFVEFDSGSTPTPIPIKNCLPFDRVIEIAVYFMKNKKLPDHISWEKA